MDNKEAIELEKERKNKMNLRLVWLFVVLDIALLAYLVIQIILLFR